MKRVHLHLLRHTFACLYLIRYRDPFARKSRLGHTTLNTTNHHFETVRQMDVVRTDTSGAVDDLDTHLLDINLRGRLKHKRQ